MKIIALPILLIASIFTTGCPSTKIPPPVSPIPAGTPTYKVYVKGLVCPACAIGLRKYLMKLSFVEHIHVDYKTGLVLIYEINNRIDHKGVRKLDKPRIAKAVEDSGYDVNRFVK